MNNVYSIDSWPEYESEHDHQVHRLFPQSRMPACRTRYVVYVRSDGYRDRVIICLEARTLTAELNNQVSEGRFQIDFNTLFSDIAYWKYLQEKEMISMLSKE